jgi:N-acetyl-anhydromuramyl-L-alanine amidase AmpD
MVQDPTYVSWQYTLRSTDGHIAQHVKAKDVAWHAGNWYVNAKSIGLEHEGFLAAPDAWYTEAMYRSSARLVTYLAKKYGIPLDRQHILGHDTVPGPTSANIPGMHTDPGPYWDWQHYFALLGKPLHADPGIERRARHRAAPIRQAQAGVHGLRHQGRALRGARFERRTAAHPAALGRYRSSRTSGCGPRARTPRPM